ncbi:nitroreductase [Streptomyces sp. RFCAC02]|uniref:nitroreductase n=1 Tax=Streptomyces sp. RFCAC02 TaxID=2499143 RepID=UPI0010222FDB|nr:nitroreductase [Streptomyces sp. RFCAC02]
MDVYEAVASRRAVRRFSGEPVSRSTLRRVLSAATRSPSGANLQPWHVRVLTGAPLADLKERTAARVAAGDPGDEREYRMYPPELAAPYRARRDAAAEQRYAALGIAREDRRSRADAVAANWDCFGAPAALFCYIDRAMGPAQWADVGMYLQTVMLLLRAEGLHSCPQMAWSVYHRTVAAVVAPPPELLLFCGVSIGFEDPAAHGAPIGRAPFAETVAFIDGRSTAGADPAARPGPE